MPQMNFDLEDGKPPVSFVLKPDDCVRFVAFMRECNEGKKDAARYEWLRQRHDSKDTESLWHVRDNTGQPVAAGELDGAIDAAMAT